MGARSQGLALLALVSPLASDNFNPRHRNPGGIVERPLAVFHTLMTLKRRIALPGICINRVISSICGHRTLEPVSG